MMYEFLRKVPLFSDLPQADLEQLCQSVEEVRLPAGAELFAEGDPGDRAYIIQEGQLEIIKLSNNRHILLGAPGPGDMIGELALLEAKPRMASARARNDTLLLAIRKETMDHLLDTSLTATHAMFYTILGRWRATETLLRQSEKMAQLGALVAGVAHELNNPAAAVQRGTGQLPAAVSHFGQARARLNRLTFTPSQQEALATLTTRTQEQAVRPAVLDALALSDRESALETWLEEQGVESAWETAPALASLNYDPSDLAARLAPFAAEHLSAVIDWLRATYTVYNLLAEIGHGAERISGIVKALKAYSYLDQAPVQTVDIHEGVENSLLILRHKLRQGITIQREYAPNLPKIEGYGSELNQVWTNILDNAADALGGHGHITLRTRQEGEWIVVEIEDNGPGIPPEVQPRIFDPFFTTKPPGEGSGLGLEISHNIIVHKHRGDIKVFSRPGKTCFQVWLPINFEAR